MTCYACDQAAIKPNCGSYDFSCVQCCARLVKHARPCKDLQEGHLAAIARNPLAPTRQEILDVLKEMG
mgnify:CR=1 FL=1